MRTQRFGPFEFDAARFELRRHGMALAVPTLSLKLLAYLLSHRERVVTREELLEQVWGGAVVSEGSLRQAVWELRQTFGDDAEVQRIIRTVRGRGYQFVAAVHEGGAPDTGSVGDVTDGPRAHPLVGRRQELAQLERGLSLTRSEGGRAAAILGPPGVGKTQLVRELKLRCAEQDVLALSVTADPDGAAPAFWPWLYLLRNLLEPFDTDARAAQLARFPQAARLLRPGLDAEAPLDLDLERSPLAFSVVDDLGGLLMAALGQRPTLLVLEDLQWCDAGSLALWKIVLQGLHRTRTLLLATCRSQPARDNRLLARTLEAMERSSSGFRIELAGFDEEQVAALLTSYVGATLSPALSSQVYALSRGNPLVASELALLLASSDGRAHTGDDLPADATLVIQRRLRGLPSPALEVLKAAAVIGNEFRMAEVAAVAERSAGEVLAQLELCIEHGLLLERSEPYFCFVHPLTRDAAYQLLSSTERCRLHLRAGEWLERFSLDTRGTRIHELAHHFQRAAPAAGCDKAIAYAMRCAQAAYAATAYQDAVTHYDRALACMDLDPQRSLAEKFDVALLRSEARRASGADATLLNGEFRALAEQAEQMGDTQRFAQAVLGYTGQRMQRFTVTRFIASTSAPEVALIERALSALGGAPSELRALLLCSLMGALIYSTDGRRREQAGEEALSIARGLNRPALLVRVLCTQIYCCADPSQASRRLERVNEVVEVAARHGLRNSLAEALITRALCHLGRVDVEAARADELRAKQLLSEGLTASTAARTQLIDLMRAFWEGDLARARRLMQHLHDAASDDLAERSLYLMRSAALQLLESGELQLGLMTSEAVLRAYPDAVGLHCTLASHYATLGDEQRAIDHFDKAARDGFSRLPRHMGWLAEVCLLADACWWLDDAERARLVYDQLVPHAGVFDFFLGEGAPSGPVAFWLAALAATFRDLPLARQWLAQAYDVNRQLGATMLNEYARIVDARIDALSGEMGKRRALQKLDQVMAYADARQLRWLSRSARVHREGLLTGRSVRKSIAISS